MSVAFQGSLFDQSADMPAIGDVADAVSRTHLDSGAWVDVVPSWLRGADSVFATLVESVPWQAERRKMYDQVVDVPRLVRFYGEDEPLPDPSLEAMRDVLSRHYAAELGEPFVTAGLCYYRHGDDSVAWHGDRIGRSRHEDTMVAIVSLGAHRPLLLRPNGGGRSLRFPIGHGDLLVMGGSCQRTWEHCIPKTTRSVGPRISVQFRPTGVR